LVVTSGFARLVAGRAATESDRPPARSENYPRASEAAADALVARGVGASVAFASADMSATSSGTRAALGWRPTHPGLLADLDRPAYFPG
jgi:hypothetical protein